MDYKGNVWIGGNGRGTPPPKTQSLTDEQGPGRGQGPAYFRDNEILKFTQDGKFLMQIGKPGQSKGSNDIDNLKAAGQAVRGSEDQ